MEIFAETIRPAPGIYLQASSRKFRLFRLPPWDPGPDDEALLETGDVNVTRQMLAGAFYAGFPVRSSDDWVTPGTSAPSLLCHIYSLAGTYQTTHATPPTMRRAAERLAARGQRAAAEHCLQVAEEESGHDALALKDIAALGLPAGEFVGRLRPGAALALVDLFSRFAESDEPIAVLGYAYALERTALFATDEFIAAIECLIPGGIKATRCLRVHSAAGIDAEHVAESIAFISTLPPRDRAAIAQAIYETVRLQCMAPADYPGDEMMRALLDEFGWSMAGATADQ